MAGEAPAQEREFAARPERCREASAVRGRGTRKAGPRAPVVAWRLRGTPREGPGRPRHGGGGEGGHRYITRRPPRHRRPGPPGRARTAAVPGQRAFPPRLSRPRSAATGPGCGASGLRVSGPALPPIPPPAGIAHLPRCPTPPCPAAPPRPASRAPAPPAAARCACRGREEGRGRSHTAAPRRATVHARPTLKEGGPARSATDPAPPPQRARATASPRPLRPDRWLRPRPAPSGRIPGSAPAPPPAGGGQLCARCRLKLAPPHPHSLPRGARARARSRLACGDPPNAGS